MCGFDSRPRHYRSTTPRAAPGREANRGFEPSGREEEGELSDIASVVRHVFNVSLNRAATIARTEVGTAFNVGRMNNMMEHYFF